MHCLVISRQPFQLWPFSGPRLRSPSLHFRVADVGQDVSVRVLRNVHRVLERALSYVYQEHRHGAGVSVIQVRNEKRITIAC